MTPRPDDAVELLDRALAYTRVCLAEVAADMLGRPTPCARWTLDALLTHMSDSLDAFAEGAAGEVPLRPAGPLVTATDPVGDAAIPTVLMVETAALEIAVHGWDVAQATGRRTPVPEPLARRLLPVARTVVTDADRGTRFAPARPATGPTDAHRLLAFLGRS